MSNFDKALAFALKWEGGYVNDPHDLGGETNKGVTHATYNSYRVSKGLPKQSVKLLTEAELEDIYKTRYWTAAFCDRLPVLSSICMFDWAVNAGVSRAIKTLQAVVGTVADGVYGAATQKAVEAYVKIHGDKALAKAYNQSRRAKYHAWGKGSQAKFLNGWLNRLNNLDKTLGL